MITVLPNPFTPKTKFINSTIYIIKNPPIKGGFFVLKQYGFQFVLLTKPWATIRRLLTRRHNG